MTRVPLFRGANSCSTCRISALQLFINSFVPVQNPRAFARFPRSIAAYSTFKPSLSLRSGPAIQEPRQQESSPVATTGGDGNVTTSEDATPPWYLQVEPPKHSTLLYEPSPLPDVPDGAPKIVGPLLRQLSEDLGMDSIELLDLRGLDPPAALGSELIMLFGTARSERHLHVSAGRLVQWLRGRGINADADGLLGRNELKTRLRRKARKEKLLGSSGVMRGGDDGISTGWICINLGRTGWSPAEHTVVGPDGRSAGFGAANGGSTLVVQLLTESRREELELEKLWVGMLKRSREHQEAIAGNDAARPEAASLGRLSPGQPQPGGGRRFFSTSTSHRQDALAGLKNIMTGTSQHPDPLAAITEIFANGSTSKVSLMNRLQQYVDSLPEENAIRVLTPGPDGTEAPFRRVFEVVLQALTPRERWISQVWLQITTQKLGIPVYDIQQIQQLVYDMGAIPVVASEDHFTGLIQAAFAHPAKNDAEAREQANIALQVIDIMQERGLQVLRNEVIIAVLEAVLRSGPRLPETKRILASFELLLSQSSLPCPDEGLLIRLLDAYANAENWDGFWKTWRIPPKFSQPRSASMYAHLYRRFADDGHRARAIDALRQCVHEMVSEVPPVSAQGYVREALLDCIRVADPHAQGIAEEVVIKDELTRKLANREFVGLLRRLGVEPRAS